MMRTGIQVAWLADGRLHLNEGPIDLIIEAFAALDGRNTAYRAAIAAFEDILPGLVAELAWLRCPMVPGSAVPEGPVARRMLAACAPHAGHFVTPMAAVAGAVADHVLSAMVAAASLDRAYVNDGGDIALHLAPGHSLSCGMVADVSAPRLDGRAAIHHDTPVRGIATSGRAMQGQGGRSFSLGIADAVTVFAETAAAADVAATLIANRIDLHGHPAIIRAPAGDIDPDSDLGALPVTVAVGPLSRDDVRAALQRGHECAESMRRDGLIEAAALFLRGEGVTVGAAGAPAVGAMTGPDTKNVGLGDDIRRSISG